MENTLVPNNEAVNPMPRFETKSEVKPELVALAKQNVKYLTEIDLEDFSKQAGVEKDVESLGIDIQREVANKSSLLSTTIGDLGKQAETGSLSSSLIMLRNQVEGINPGKFNLEPGGITKLVGKFFPDILSRPMKNYMTKFRTAESVIGEIIRGISEGQHMLERDNITLQDRVIELRNLDKSLQKAIQIGQIMDDDIVKIIDAEVDFERKKFLKQKVLVKLRTRIVDLQTVRTVSQQGILSMDLTVDTNKQLIQNAERTRTVTISALKVAVELRKALANQREVLNTITAINETTNDIILGNSQLLKDNAVKITKGAMEATLDLEKLKASFDNIYSAIEETEKFREEALPRLKDTIGQFNLLSTEAEKKIVNMEKSKKLEGAVNLKLS